MSNEDTERYQLPSKGEKSFARTNPQTIVQRANLITKLLPGTMSIAEICCGDCTHQWMTYLHLAGAKRFRGLDYEPFIVAQNHSRGIDCVRGDAIDPLTMLQFMSFDVIFYGPPLSIDCDGHQLLEFGQVRPRYADFSRMIWCDLAYEGTLVCICPRTTTMGDISALYQQVRKSNQNAGLRMIHHSYSTVTGRGEATPLRLKYIELWFSTRLEDLWEVHRNES